MVTYFKFLKANQFKEQILCDGCDAATGAVLLAETQETVLGDAMLQEPYGAVLLTP